MGLTCAPGRVRRLMRERGLKALQRRSFVPKTSDGRSNRPSLNLLLDEPLPETPHTLWAGDICFGFASPLRASLRLAVSVRSAS